MPQMPACCRSYGLLFADTGDTRRCLRHITAEQRALLAKLDQRNALLGVTDGWPYGPNVYVQARQRLLDWAERYGLQHADRGCCLTWLRGRPCDGLNCDLNGGGWRDHVTGWSRRGEPALVLAQPYHIYSDGLAALGNLASSAEWEVVVSTGWYGHGTVSIEVWRANAYRRAAIPGQEPAVATNR